jgi:hypothetical protein
MLLGRFSKFPTSRTLLPMAKHLETTTCPRYFRLELEEVEPRQTLDNGDEAS